MPIVVQSRRRRLENIQKDYPEATIIDVTSKGDNPWVKFSPFYPHGNIPVPFYPRWTSQSVEGIWQGLKVFETQAVDRNKMKIRDMKGIKRTVRRFGKCKGHSVGYTKLLSYIDARKFIYLPSYLWVLENPLADLVAELRKMSETQTLVLLDYETNGDVENYKKPLSHAYLIKHYVEGNYPSFDFNPEET
ncbi:hypothetical protein IQ215_02615 [Cyanobacterium stanieri LEGE 03274]|uniref:Uncharacterized protein n=2 Tax=Cyanobacterium TaxID=102234 RepID=A0ABR9V117_9CHRO|nr:hypothetical protein [Cyanobacterium stanieri LEGE 03274]